MSDSEKMSVREREKRKYPACEKCLCLCCKNKTECPYTQCKYCNGGAIVGCRHAK